MQDAPRSGAAPFRTATFNASLNRSTKGELVADLSAPDDRQAQTVAEIMQRVGPDIMLVNEFGHDAAGAASCGDDALSLGDFPSHFGMALFSKHPILADQVRTF